MDNYPHHADFRHVTGRNITRMVVPNARSLELTDNSLDRTRQSRPFDQGLASSILEARRSNFPQSEVAHRTVARGREKFSNASGLTRCLRFPIPVVNWANLRPNHWRPKKPAKVSRHDSIRSQLKSGNSLETKYPSSSGSNNAICTFKGKQSTVNKLVGLRTIQSSGRWRLFH